MRSNEKRNPNEDAVNPENQFEKTDQQNDPVETNSGAEIFNADNTEEQNNNEKESGVTVLKSEHQKSQTASSNEETVKVIDSHDDDKNGSDEVVAPKRKPLVKYLIGGVLFFGSIATAGYYYFGNNDGFINLVNLSGSDSPNPSANEIAKLKLEFENLRSELDQYVGVNEAVSEMENQIGSLKQRVDNLKTQLEDEISNFELVSEQRSVRLKEMSDRLAQLKVAEHISVENRNEIDKLRIEIKEIHENSATAESKILERLEAYKNLLDLAAEKEVPVKQSVRANTKQKQVSSQNESYGELITRIGPLRLETIVSHGSQRVAELTDNISGAIPIIEGDRIGQYHIRKINSDSVLIQSLAGEKFTLVQEG